MRRFRGFSLVEIAVVLVIAGFMIAMVMALLRPLSSQQRRSTTLARIQLVDAALAQFVGLQKRLPCPADGTIVDPANPAYGFETSRTAVGGCNDASNQRKGIVPWRTLGITEADATDGWDHRFTYRLDRGLAADKALDMSMCDPASTNDPNVAVAACDPACTAAALASCTPPRSFIRDKGLEVRKADGVTIVMNPSPAPADAPTGAAYVLISQGETGGGALTPNGVPVPRAGDGAQEQLNYADRALNAPGYYVDDDVLETPHFDDLVSRPMLLTVINKAALGPRSH